MHARNNKPLAIADTAVATPHYFDGQVLHASDLALGQDASRLELARMRALLHGWGVVAGLIPLIADKDLLISPGYGVLPSGGEIHLPDPMSLPLPTVNELARRCGDDPGACGLGAGDDGSDREDEHRTDPGPVWLAVGADHQLTSPRPGISSECAHPANAAQPTRRCHQVALYLLCQLPEGLRIEDPACRKVAPYICGDPPLPVPLPAPVTAEADLLILGRLVPEGDAVTLDLRDRRRLLPNYLLQAWLQSCICPLTEEPEPEPTKPIDWDTLLREMTILGLHKLPLKKRPNTVLGMYRRIPQIQGSTVRLLTEAGIAGPAAFLVTPARRIQDITGMTGRAILDAREELTWISRLIEF